MHVNSALIKPVMIAAMFKNKNLKKKNNKQRKRKQINSEKNLVACVM